MSTQYRSLTGHARRIKIIGIAGGVVVLVGGVMLGIGEQPEYKYLTRYGGWVGMVGFAGLVIAGALVNYAKCPTCGARLSQGKGSDGKKYDGIFICRACDTKWLTTENSNLNGD